MSREIDTVPDDVIYHVCKLILRGNLSMTKAMEWLHTAGYPSATREWPRQMLVQAFNRGLLDLPGRENYELAMRLQNGSGASCRVSADKDRDTGAFEAVAELAADQVLHLIRQVHTAGQDGKDPSNEVHIGLAAGGTSRAFATHLALKLRRERKLPELWLHTLTSGFFDDNPDSAPVVSLGQFKGIKPEPQYVVLYSAPIVLRKDAKAQREFPFTRKAFEEAAKLDIVVTSVSVADHDHSLFKLATKLADPDRATQRIERLVKLDWAGDIMWQPYTTTGRPIEGEVLAVSVVNFQDLVDFSNKPAKHVVCIAGPCANCGAPKHKAIVPLLGRAQTHRPFNHLVTTQSTAIKICEELKW